VKIGEDVKWERLSFDPYGQRFRLYGLKGAYDLFIPLIGEHQMENAANAVAAIELLKGAIVDKKAIGDGIAKVNWPGRMQVLGSEPWVIVDGAHNAYSIQKLGQAIKEYFRPGAIKMILGFGNERHALIFAGFADARHEFLRFST
jgi:dihydrofolate synthase/folylpolyglutamate synthase